MADSTNNLPQVVAGSGAAQRVNDLFSASSPSMLYALNPVTTTGLTFGFLGGRYRSTAIANGTVSLTGSTTNYIVAARSTGAVSVSTATTNWNDTQNFERLYLVVTGAGSITSYEDHRALGQRSVVLPAVVTDSGTARDVESSDSHRYIRMTSASAKTATIRPNSTHVLPDNFETHLRCVGAGNLTLVAGSGVTINPPAGGTLVLSAGMTVTVKKVGTDEYDLMGQTVPA
jgi:hypothetical protein